MYTKQSFWCQALTKSLPNRNLSQPHRGPAQNTSRLVHLGDKSNTAKMKENDAIAVIIIVIFFLLVLISFGIYKFVSAARTDSTVSGSSGSRSTETQSIVD